MFRKLVVAIPNEIRSVCVPLCLLDTLDHICMPSILTLQRTLNGLPTPDIQPYHPHVISAFRLHSENNDPIPVYRMPILTTNVYNRAGVNYQSLHIFYIPEFHPPPVLIARIFPQPLVPLEIEV